MFARELREPFVVSFAEHCLRSRCNSDAARRMKPGRADLTTVGTVRLTIVPTAMFGRWCNSGFCRQCVPVLRETSCCRTIRGRNGTAEHSNGHCEFAAPMLECVPLCIGRYIGEWLRQTISYALDLPPVDRLNKCSEWNRACLIYQSECVVHGNRSHGMPQICCRMVAIHTWPVVVGCGVVELLRWLLSPA
jgi:hypothetical protein